FVCLSDREVGKPSARRIHGNRSLTQVWSAGVTVVGWSKLQTVTSISSASAAARKVSGVPQFGQNERRRPAHGNSLGFPVVNLKPLQLNDAHVTKGAPPLRRQSKQWQWVIL